MSGDNDVNGILSGESKAYLKGDHISGKDPNRPSNPERGFGKLANQSFDIAEDNISKIERHLSKPIFLEEGAMAPENVRMIERLRIAFTEGRPITEADASFYFHEMYEADLMDNMSLDYDTAHRMALDYYDVADFTIYHPDVIREFSRKFGRLWLTFWGIGGQ